MNALRDLNVDAVARAVNFEKFIPYLWVGRETEQEKKISRRVHIISDSEG